MNKIKTYNTPIYNYLREYAQQDINIFHMPGHKLAKGIPQQLAQDILKLDVTEIEGTDNLHYPEGIIKDAQELAAKAFGADKTFFLVNGSTCGIEAAIMSTCARGQKIIIARDAHKSVVSGLILSGAEPVFVYPEYIYSFGITGEVTAKSIQKSLCQHPDAVAVLITRPNYYGICSDIEEISSIVHAHGKILIVDEAHGAHFVFNSKLPDSALQHGADICIQSAHKTLPAVTQGAYLHVKGNRVDIDRLKLNLGMLQTSSPSYIIMSYLDIARELMEIEGQPKLDNLIKEIEWFNNELNKYPEYKVLSNEDLLKEHTPTYILDEQGIQTKCTNDQIYEIKLPKGTTDADLKSEYDLASNTSATKKYSSVSKTSNISVLRNSAQNEMVGCAIENKGGDLADLSENKIASFPSSKYSAERKMSKLPPLEYIKDRTLNETHELKDSELEIVNDKIFNIARKEMFDYKSLTYISKENKLHDPTRLVINISKLGISGYYAEKLLREKFKTQVEMADYGNLVFITTIADSHETFSRLLEAMKGLLEIKHNQNLNNLSNQNDIIKKYKKLHNSGMDSLYAEHFTKIGKTATANKNERISPYDAYISQKVDIPVNESCGRICANVITPYPPGVPILYPGESINKSHIQYINALIEAGGHINGIQNKKYIQVIK